MRQVLVFVLFFLAACVNGQNVGIGTTTPHSSALLELKSNTKGIIIPKMTTAERTGIASPARGLIVYDSTENTLYNYNGISWKAVNTNHIIADADGNTSVDVEGTPNVNRIEFQVNGEVRYFISRNQYGLQYLGNNSLNTLMGNNAGFAMKSSTIDNIVVGWETGYYDSTGINNVFIGNYSGKFVGSGSDNVAIGDRAAEAMRGANNINIGAGAGATSVQTYDDIHIGKSAGNYDSNSTRTIAIGNYSLLNNRGSGNISIGHASIQNNGNGHSLVAVGDSSMFNNGLGLLNVGIGNTAIGKNGLKLNVQGNYNTSIGFKSGENINGGSNNSMIGANTSVGNALINNATAIGANAKVNISNALVLGDNNVNVGIGTSSPAKGKLEIFGALGGGTVASFGTDGTGISIQRNWPTIAFNQYRDNSNVARYMGTGKASWLYYEPTAGAFGWDVYDVAGTADQAVTATGTRALTILSNGNIGVRSSGGNNSLAVERKNNIGGSLYLVGTTHATAFQYGAEEHTYIRGGLDGSKVIINDIVNGKTLTYGKNAIGNYPDNNYNPVLASEIWGAMALTNSYSINVQSGQSITNPNTSSYVTVSNSSSNSAIELSIANGSINGQLLIIQGSGSNGFTIRTNGFYNVNAGTGTTIVMSGGDVLTLVWRTETSKWTLMSFSDN